MYIAKKALELEPLSDDRSKFLGEGYALTHHIMSVYRNVSKRGANNRSIEFLSKYIKKTNEQMIVFEAGVGDGFALKELVEKNNNIKYVGCDIELSEDIKTIMKNNGNILIKEMSLYKALSELPDEYIDVFYADNVFEHLCPDEFPAIMKMLYKKIKMDGVLILFIPNRITGPHDISKFYIKRGERAKGFHYMESSYSDVITWKAKYNFKIRDYTFGTKHHIFHQKNMGGVSVLKVLIELIMRQTNISIINRAFVRIFCLDVFVLNKA